LACCVCAPLFACSFALGVCGWVGVWLVWCLWAGERLVAREDVGWWRKWGRCVLVRWCVWAWIGKEKCCILLVRVARIAWSWVVLAVVRVVSCWLLWFARDGGVWCVLAWCVVVWCGAVWWWWWCVCACVSVCLCVSVFVCVWYSLGFRVARGVVECGVVWCGVAWCCVLMVVVCGWLGWCPSGVCVVCVPWWSVVCLVGCGGVWCVVLVCVGVCVCVCVHVRLLVCSRVRVYSRAWAQRR